MAKKGKFELNKSGDHDFDLSKAHKRKFDLRKDDDEIEVLSPQGVADPIVDKATAPDKPATDTEKIIKPASVADIHSQVPNVSDEPEVEEIRKKNNTWMWVILILLILILLVWWIYPSSKNVEDPVVAQEVENVVTDSTDSESAQIDQLANPATEEDSSIVVQTNAQSEASDRQPSSGNSEMSQVPAATGTTSNTPVASDGSIEAEALNVIRGVYGNNPIRKEKLGDRYYEIQRYVNQMKKNGKF
ncbi:MAG: hypothetical protein K2K64_07445 [Muribaculaceae bacterium]|nr:hypothetical protein [Muribaculaceae bacterium]